MSTSKKKKDNQKQIKIRSEKDLDIEFNNFYSILDNLCQLLILN